MNTIWHTVMDRFLRQGRVWHIVMDTLWHIVLGTIMETEFIVCQIVYSVTLPWTNKWYTVMDTIWHTVMDNCIKIYQLDSVTMFWTLSDMLIWTQSCRLSKTQESYFIYEIRSHVACFQITADAKKVSQGFKIPKSARICHNSMDIWWHTVLDTTIVLLSKLKFE